MDGWRSSMATAEGTGAAQHIIMELISIHLIERGCSGERERGSLLTSNNNNVPEE